MHKYKIIIVDDHEMFRDGIKFLLSGYEVFEVIGEASNGKEFLEILQRELPDIVLMDIDMPVMNGIDATKECLAMYPKQKIIVLSMFGDESYYYQMIQAGVKGFILKKSGSNELVNAINTVLEGKEYFSTELLKNVILSIGSGKKVTNDNQHISINFTNRENEILTHICNGKTTKEIANLLNISPRTVEVHKSNIFYKTGTNNTGNLIAVAIKNQLVKI